MSLTPRPVYRIGCGGNGRQDNARGAEARLARGRRLTTLRHDAGALHPIQLRPVAAATSQPGHARPLS